MSAHFDQNQDLWIEIDASQNLPANLETNQRIEVVPDLRYGGFSTGNQPCKAITHMNLTKYISELKLTKIIQEITKDNQ